MHNLPFIVVSKFGITDRPENRVREVSETTPGYVFYLVAPSLVPFGKMCESLVHGLYVWANLKNLFPLWSGSGSTEWFLNANPIVALLVYWAYHIPGASGFVGQYIPDEYVTRCFWLVIFSPVVWLDGLLWYLVFVFFSRIVFLLILGALFYTVVNM